VQLLFDLTFVVHLLVKLGQLLQVVLDGMFMFLQVSSQPLVLVQVIIIHLFHEHLGLIESLLEDTQLVNQLRNLLVTLV
jgi:hypothetical protein